MPDYSTWTMGSEGIKMPPLEPIPSDIVKPGDALCDICRTIDFEPSAFFIGMEQQGLRSSSSDEDGLAETDEEDDDDDDDDSIALSNGNVSSPSDEDTDEAEDDASEMSSESFAHDFINLGKITDVRSRTHCPFCRLALAAIGGARVPDTKHGEPVSVEVSVIKNGVCPRGAGAGDDENDNNDGITTTTTTTTLPTRVLMPSASAPTAFVDEAAVFPEIAVLAADAPAAAGSAAGLVRAVPRERIDFARVANWLALCEQFHGDACRKRPGLDDFPVHPATMLREFRLIDVEEACLVRAGGDSRYTALSYVWGSARVLRTGEWAPGHSSLLAGRHHFHVIFMLYSCYSLLLR